MREADRCGSIEGLASRGALPRLQAPRGTHPIASDRPSLGPVYAVLGATALTVVAADQITKQLALDNLHGEGVDVLGGLVTLRLAFNPGGAFGVLPGVPWLFAVAAILISGVVLWTARTAESLGAAAALGLVLGGGAGNVIDRLFRDLDGRVVDFIDLHFWPLFNVADMGIVVGVLVVLGMSLKRSPGSDDTS